MELPRVLSSFLWEMQDKLDKKEIGDLLSGWDNKLLTNAQYTELRNCYVSQIDFTNLTFDEAIR
jgi:Sec7-like guanine-nucleotide exchange factor